MKYVVILGDGMADYPVDAFDGKTIFLKSNETYQKLNLKIISLYLLNNTYFVSDLFFK